MVRKLLRTLAAPVRGLHQAAYLLAVLTLGSQALALIRDRIFADTFGASETLDLYYAAFKVPDIVFALVASLVSAYVLIPRITALGAKEGRELMSQTASFLFIGGGLISLVLAAFAPILLFLLFPQFAGTPRADEFVLLSQILLLQPILLGLSSILTSVTQVKRRFLLYALSPVLYNVGIILGALVFYPLYGLPGVGIGVLIGALAHVVIHIPIVARAHLLPRLKVPSWNVLLPVMRDSAPRSLALGVGAVTTLLLASLAARTGEGGIAIFSLASNLEAVPLSLIGAAYATAAFPVLSEQAGKTDLFRATLAAAARHLIFWSAVILVLAVVLRAHIVRIVLGTGAFDWDDTRLTAAVLGILVFALITQGLVLLFSRAYYAAGRSWNPLLIQVAGLFVSSVSAYGFLAAADSVPLFRYFIESLLRVEDVPGSGILFIALGFLAGQLVMGVIALTTLRSVAPGVAASLIRPFSEGLAAAILGGSAAYAALALMGHIAPLTTLAAVFTEALVAGIVGITVSAAILVLLENQEFRDLFSALKKLTSRALRPYGAYQNDGENS